MQNSTYIIRLPVYDILWKNAIRFYKYNYPPHLLFGQKLQAHGLLFQKIDPTVAVAIGAIEDKLENILNGLSRKIGPENKMKTV